MCMLTGLAVYCDPNGIYYAAAAVVTLVALAVFGVRAICLRLGV